MRLRQAITTDADLPVGDLPLPAAAGQRRTIALGHAPRVARAAAVAPVFVADTVLVADTACAAYAAVAVTDTALVADAASDADAMLVADTVLVEFEAQVPRTPEIVAVLAPSRTRSCRRRSIVLPGC
ncbi:hypothetical protein ACLMAJ_03390 [Nocardia sp. KC 131]|uniref:hypothetical protein n=1 Tax=Nocardia arseniciresistens TaxID=3392119 RepID=UPI00398E87DB